MIGFRDIICFMHIYLKGEVVYLDCQKTSSSELAADVVGRADRKPQSHSPEKTLAPLSYAPFLLT